MGLSGSDIAVIVIINVMFLILLYALYIGFFTPNFFSNWLRSFKKSSTQVSVPQGERELSQGESELSQEDTESLSTIYSELKRKESGLEGGTDTNIKIALEKNKSAIQKTEEGLTDLEKFKTGRFSKFGFSSLYSRKKRQERREELPNLIKQGEKELMELKRQRETLQGRLEEVTAVREEYEEDLPVTRSTMRKITNYFSSGTLSPIEEERGGRGETRGKSVSPELLDFLRERS